MRTMVPRSYDPLKLGVLPLNVINNFNGDCYFREMYTDTTYKVTTDRQIPTIVIDKGKYKIPLEIMSDYNRFEKEGDRYITYDYGQLVSKYLFLNSSYNRKEYYDIWDTRTEKVISRRILSENGGISGIPVSIEGVTFNVWPSYVSGDCLYCIVNAAKAYAFIPSINEYSNPVILELKIKP